MSSYSSARRPSCVAALLLTAWICVSTSVCAEPSSEAYVGEPFGVGRVTIDVFRGEPSIPLSDERFTVLEEAGRAMYPVLKMEPIKQLVRQLLSIETPRKVTIYYLFQGDEPFDLSVFSPVEQAVRVKPIRDVSAHHRLLDEWWSEYSDRWNRLRGNAKFPPVAENFLTATFARRLGRTLPEPSGGLFNWNKKKDSVLSDLFAGDAYQLRIDREMLLDQTQPDAERVPLPEPVVWREPAIDASQLKDVAVEPIAAHVPAECFYARFGKFTNYLWFRDFKTKWEGDLQNMLRRHGIRRAAAQRSKQQMSLQENVLAKIFGPQVIADAAIIGLDPYTAQGAGVGILFQAKNSEMLTQDLTRQRRMALTNFPDAAESTVRIADRDVSLIATPDGRVRSYYVQDGDFHLVSTSATLVERFLEAGAGEESLADLPSFRLARQRLAVDRNDAVFVFVSEKFFQNLCSPHYRIETMRRVRSAREPLLLEMAALTAATENLSQTSTDNLIAADVLPPDFAARTDGNALEATGDHTVDSRRGAPGFFVPVADMEVADASAAEVATYRQFIERFQAEVGQMPPIAIGLERQPHEGGGETMVVEVFAEPLDGLKLDSLRDHLGDPDENHLRPVEGDVVSCEAILDMALPLGGGELQMHHLFGGLRDFRSVLTVENGVVMPGEGPAEFVRGYLGAWPKPGLLQWFTASSEPPDDGEPEPVGEKMWRAQQDEFLLISFKPDVIEEVLPQLHMEPAGRPAQVWLRVDDLTDKQLTDTVNALGYMRSREASVAASRMMNSLANQFHIPRPQCRELAERLVDGTFVCPLGGEYELFAPEKDLEVWVSTALPPENRFLLTKVPEDFHLPLLDWFRGIRGDFCLEQDALSAHLEIDMTSAAVP